MKTRITEYLRRRKVNSTPPALISKRVKRIAKLAEKDPHVYKTYLHLVERRENRVTSFLKKKGNIHNANSLWRSIEDVEAFKMRHPALRDELPKQSESTPTTAVTPS